MLRERAASDITAPTLDDVMRGLWHEFGETGVGVPEDACALFSKLTQIDLSKFFAQCVNGTADPDWSTLLAPFGIHYHQRVTASASDRGGRDEAHPHTNARALGMILSEGGTGLPVVKHVISGSAAASAGLSAGDTWVAIDGLRASTTTLAKHLPRFAAGDTLAIDYFRHDQLQHTVLHIMHAKLDTVWLSVASEAAPNAAPNATVLRQRWLSAPLR